MNFINENNDLINNLLITFYNNLFEHLSVDELSRIRFTVFLFLLKHNNSLNLSYKRRLRQLDRNTL